MAIETKVKKLRKHTAQGNFFAVVQYAFRIFAHQSAIVLGSAWAFVGAVIVILVWVLTGPTFHFSDTWQLVINTATTVVTFLMAQDDQVSPHRRFRIRRLEKIGNLHRLARSGFGEVNVVEIRSGLRRLLRCGDANEKWQSDQ